MADPLNRDQILDELEYLATVEHALVVEYLSVFCALGHDLAAEEGGAPPTRGVVQPARPPCSRSARCRA